jgi:hypothetical protein
MLGVDGREAIVMDTRASVEIRTALQDREAIERACIAAARDAALLHRMHGVPVVVWKDGQMIEIAAEELERECDRREAELNAKLAKSSSQA